MLSVCWSSGLHEHTPPDVSKRTWISTARIERLAKEFAEQRPAAVAIIAGAALAQTNGLFNARAVNALNALVECGHAGWGVLHAASGCAGRHRRRAAKRKRDSAQPQW